MKHLILFLFFSILISQNLQSQSSITATYSAGDIPTSLTTYDPACNGPVTPLSITLPSTPGSYEIVGIDISYDMTALGTGWMVDQRSQVYCQNTANLEPAVFSGVGNSNGTYSYSRLNVDIANGDYNPNEVLTFEMHDWRVFGGSGCNSTFNKVDDGTWTITVYYNLCPPVNVTLTTQMEVNDFVIDLTTIYSGCQEVKGGLSIGNFTPTDIISVVGLAGLQSIGALEIENNPLLTTFSFPNITELFWLSISENNTLTSFNFPILTNVDLLLKISKNPLLPLVEFSLLDTLIGFHILGNDILSNVQVPNLIFAGQIIIGDDDSYSQQNISQLNFSSLELINDDIYIDAALSLELVLPILQEIIGLSSTMIGPNLNTLSMPNLEKLEKLSCFSLSQVDSINLDKLRYVGDELIIDGYDYETTLENMILNMLDLTSIRRAEKISITNFNNLADCCYFLTMFPEICGDITLNNGVGCTSWIEAIDSCAIYDQDEDGISSSSDNCPDHYNPKQEDQDNDNIGNACDNCPLVSNSGQVDANNNFIGDDCEVAEPGKVGVNTTSPKSGLEISISELYLSDTHRGLIMTNANGECFRILIDIDGNLKSVEIDCPN